MEGIEGDLAMLFRMMWHSGRYRIPDILEMLVLDCAFALGVDQHKRPNLPHGQTAPEPEMSAADKLQQPTKVMTMTPEQLAAITGGIQVGTTG